MTGLKYPVNDYYSTVQGEGVLTGVPMMLLRLHGCPVGCPFCDTKETWEVRDDDVVGTFEAIRGANPKWIKAEASEIAAKLNEERKGEKWVLLTGGEPAMLPLRSLVDWLHKYKFKVAVETSGTAGGMVNASADWVCVSPKENMPGGRAILPEAVRCADELKFVIGREDDLGRVKKFLTEYATKPTVTVCLQPMSQSKKATQLCIAAVGEYGWRLSIQMHKYISVR